MSSRFHNKFHRHNHHTVAINDPRYPDASHDPIASFDSPFLGPFVLYGPLSAIALSPANVAQTFGLDASAVPPAGIFIAPATSAVAIRAEGGIVATGNIVAAGDVTFNGSLSAANIIITGNVVDTYSAPMTATGEFLQIQAEGLTRYIRLWNT